MFEKSVIIFFRFLSLGAIIMAAGFWTSAEVETRSKHNDEQTLIGGAIWTQTIITIGLIISAEVDDHVHPFVHGYFLLSGILLLIVTGVILITVESKKLHKRKQRSASEAQTSIPLPAGPASRPFDRTYLTIGVLCFLSGAFATVEFVFLCLKHVKYKKT